MHSDEFVLKKGLEVIGKVYVRIRFDKAEQICNISVKPLVTDSEAPLNVGQSIIYNNVQQGASQYLPPNIYLNSYPSLVNNQVINPVINNTMLYNKSQSITTISNIDNMYLLFLKFQAK